jgi:3-methylcrotonyl-CoA carboxylase alpha subunit
MARQLTTVHHDSLPVGLDLVELQLRVAAGEELPVTQEQVQLRGHAAEARIYSEQPHNNFLPAGGTVQHLSSPCNSVQFENSYEVPRWDSAVQVGDTVGVHYDPLIGKLVTWGADRQEAMEKLLNALKGLQIAGLPTNIEFQKRLVAHPAFLQGGFTTAFLKDHGHEVCPEDVDSPEAQLALRMAVLAHAVAHSKETRLNVEPESPWGIRDGFRVWGKQPYAISVKTDPHSLEQVRGRTGGWCPICAYQIADYSNCDRLHLDRYKHSALDVIC